jgi:hypothetical protein
MRYIPYMPLCSLRILLFGWLTLVFRSERWMVGEKIQNLIADLNVRLMNVVMAGNPSESSDGKSECKG